MGNDTQNPRPTGSPAFGNGVVTFTVDATHIAMQTHFNSTYTDSFTIVQPPSSVQTPILLVPVFALAGIAVAAVFVWRRRKARKKSDDGPWPREPGRRHGRGPTPSWGYALLLGWNSNVSSIRR
jgi:hypothetical protein